MANTYFQFKQFLIYQDRCAMKVCTDACLFGAWVADKIQHPKAKIQNVLDVGCGTGLLSLMVVQKNAQIITDAVEIDEAAFQQAKENFEASPWKERLNIFNEPIQQFANSHIRESKYDLLISNPPFYASDLKGDDVKRNLALHSSALQLDELINIADDLLTDDGNFFMLLPYHRTKDLETLIGRKFFVKEKVLVKQTEKHVWFRSMWWLARKTVNTVYSEIIIDTGGNYSKEFTGLLKDYYLRL